MEETELNRFIGRLGNMGETALDQGLAELQGENTNQGWGQGHSR